MAATDYWETSTGKAATVFGTLLTQGDGIETVAYNRRPIRRWERRLALWGIGLDLFPFAFLLIPLVVASAAWQHSYRPWREGKVERPRLAIVAGAVTVGAVIAMAGAVAVGLVGLF